jgi:hypothetical protein
MPENEGAGATGGTTTTDPAAGTNGTGTPPPDTGTKPDDERAGGNAAVLADLAKERKDRQRLETELAAERAKNMTEGEKAIEDAKAAARAEALAEVNARVLRSEVKAIAAGKLADPSDAARLLDLSRFEVDADGNVDAKAIAAAIDALVKEKPYLGVTRRPGPLPGSGATPTPGEGSQSMDDWLRTQRKGR